MKKTLLTGALLALLPLTTLASAPPDDSFFPIMAWNSVPSDPALLSRMHDCGLTVAGFATIQQLSSVQAAGMKAIVSDPRASNYDWSHPIDTAVATKNIDSLTAELKGNPTVFGYYLRDEPEASLFPSLGAIASLIHEKQPGVWPYINLFPNYATPGQMASKDYSDYLEKFIATCHPTILSYDNYSLLDNATIRPEYFSNLQAIHDASVNHHIPFWNIVLTCGHFSYRPPSDADLRFEIYTTLAYGGRGLAYFTYFCPATGNYRSAPVDQFNHETSTWASLQSVNLQVQKLAPTLNHLTSTRVYHFSPTPGCQSPPADSWLTSAGSPNFMVGEFTHDDGSQYIMIVNKDVYHSAPVALDFRTPAKQVLKISPYSGTLASFDGENIWLAPGAGTLLKIIR